MYTVIHRPDGSFELRTHVPPGDLSPRAARRLRAELHELLAKLPARRLRGPPGRDGPPRRLRPPSGPSPGRAVPADPHRDGA